jgi:hypothetical protein
MRHDFLEWSVIFLILPSTSMLIGSALDSINGILTVPFGLGIRLIIMVITCMYVCVIYSVYDNIMLTAF